MEYSVTWDGTRFEREKNFECAVFAVCCFALLFIILCWLAGLGLREIRAALGPEPAYPDPVCEFCGRTLDGSSASCGFDNDCHNGGLHDTARPSGGP